VIKKKDLSKEDKKTWENYIKNPSDIFDKDISLSKNNLMKKRYKFDLHGFTLENANEKVKQIVLYCVENKYKEILLITGKGIHSTNEKDIFISRDLGKLRYSVPEFLNTDAELSKYLLSISDADQKDGGDGAIIVKLKSL
tara:strand:- start:877 stop:1296 length:420 start_codon:yes stop_codon:yes gene_type:complete